jgi:CheY-like chemotaxis protein
MNLAVNARDAMPDGGRLAIQTSNATIDSAYLSKHYFFTPGEYVLLEMTDEGAGMKKETLSHIFEPFFTTKEMGRGTGLGLATVYGIVKQNNCFINVYSEPGQGTTFKVYFPRAATEEKARGTGEAPIASGSGTVLLVEDSEPVRRLVADVLEAVGYTVLSAETPFEALSLCEKEGASIDLLLTDVVMPGMSGAELRDKIVAIRPGIKILFMSGYTENVIAHRGVLREGVHFIQKPFSMRDIAAKIRQVTRQQ